MNSNETLELPRQSEATGPPKLLWLSPSKISTAIEKCFYRLYLEDQFHRDGIPLPIGYQAVGGTAVHRIAEFALKQVFAGHPLPSGKDLHDLFPSVWDDAVKEYSDGGKYYLQEEQDDPSEVIRRELHELIVPFRDVILVKLRPKLIEHKVRIEIAPINAEPFTLYGIIDYMDESGEILDWKSTKRVSSFAKQQDLKMESYAWMAHKTFGIERPRTAKVFLIRGKPPSSAFDSVRYEHTPSSMAFFEHAAIATWKAIRHDVFPPTGIGRFWCSPDLCPFWTPCRGGG